jgi:hypothetical protein
MNEERNKIILMGSLLFIVLIFGTINIKDKFKQPPIPMLDFSIEKPVSQNYTVDAVGKIIPNTILSVEDAKKPCTACHEK